MPQPAGSPPGSSSIATSTPSSQSGSHAGTVDESLKFDVQIGPNGVCKAPGMQLDHGGSRFGGCLDLGEVRIDEK